MTIQQGWDCAENILCVRLDRMGDVLMTTPAIRALKDTFSKRRITLLTSRQGSLIAPLIPEIDRVMIYDAPWMKSTPLRNGSSSDFNLIERLREAAFDAAMIFTVYSQNPLPAAFLCYMAEIPLRLAHCHENPYQLLTDWIPDPEPSQTIRHETRRQLDLVSQIGCQPDSEKLSLSVSFRILRRVLALLKFLRIDRQRPWVIVHPGGTASSRRYPPNQFAEAAQQLVLNHDFQVVFTGSRREIPLVKKIQHDMNANSTSLAGRLRLEELAALIKLSPLLISNNTGPVHMAAALGTPVVDLYALTNPQHSPWQVPKRVLYSDVPCKYCYKSVCPEEHHHCLQGVPSEAVVQAAEELLNQKSPLSLTDEVWP